MRYKTSTPVSVAALTSIFLMITAFTIGQNQIREDPDKYKSEGLNRISYNNPNIEVDLGVGLWAVPYPFDYTGDGKGDLLVGSGGKPYNGIYHFKPVSDEPGPTVFKKGERLSASTARYNMQLSAKGDEWILTEPGYEYPDFQNSKLEVKEKISFEPDFYTGRANQWKYFDYNGNGVSDLIIGASDWREYRWDDAYTDEGEWVNGPLRGFVYWIENLGTDEEPIYDKPQKILAGENPVEVYGMPSPNFADFNGNGLPDLILGDFLDKFTFFENTGTRSEPVYSPGKVLMSGADTLKMDLQMIQPSAIDWDNDGHIDLIVGDEDGRVAFVRNSGQLSSGMPEFEEPVYFKQEADEVKIGALATPYAIDWNGNGLQDLIVGNTAGYLMLVENLGGYPPKWNAPQYLEADGEVIRILAGKNGSIQGPAEAKWGYTVLSAADWNGNGLPDIIINSIWGKILWYENIGTETNPKLAAAKPIEVEWEEENPKPVWNWWNPEGNELVTQWRSTPQAIDLNEDGLMDLVALDQEGFLVYFERREIDGELKLMPPQRIFYTESEAPNVFGSGHQPVHSEAKGGGNRLASYDENGNLSYTARTRRAASPGVISSIYKTSGLFSNYDNNIEARPLRLNAGWAGASGRRKFHLVDWTGNGKLDLIVNSGINANLLENIAENPGEFVFKDRGQMAEEPIGGHTSNPVTVDWNQDGVPDLLIGGEDGFLYYKENSRIRR